MFPPPHPGTNTTCTLPIPLSASPSPSCPFLAALASPGLRHQVLASVAQRAGREYGSRTLDLAGSRRDVFSRRYPVDVAVPGPPGEVSAGGVLSCRWATSLPPGRCRAGGASLNFKCEVLSPPLFPGMHSNHEFRDKWARVTPVWQKSTRVGRHHPEAVLGRAGRASHSREGTTPTLRRRPRAGSTNRLQNLLGAWPRLPAAGHHGPVPAALSSSPPPLQDLACILPEQNQQSPRGHRQSRREERE